MNYESFMNKEKMAAENGLSREYNDSIFAILEKEKELIDLMKDPKHIANEYQDVLLKLSFVKKKMEYADKLLSEHSSIEPSTAEEQAVILGQIKKRIRSIEDAVDDFAERSRMLNKIDDASKKRKLIDFASKL